jgi:ADP-ribosylglycohydrolase
MAEAAIDPEIKIQPAWKVSIVYGMPCAIYHQLPAAYYLGARFHDDFEQAVLHALNGGGQNQPAVFLLERWWALRLGYQAFLNVFSMAWKIPPN